MAGNEQLQGRWSSTPSLGRMLLNDEAFSKDKNAEVNNMGREPSTGSLSQSSLPSQELNAFSRPSQVTTAQKEFDRDFSQAQRKRSRMGERNDDEDQGARIEELLKKMQTVIEQIVKKGDKGKTILEKINLNELFKDLCMSFVSCLSYSTNTSAKLISVHEEKERLMQKLEGFAEEKVALQQQIIELQLQVNQKPLSTDASKSNTYLYAASKAVTTAITTGKALPIPMVPEAVQHAPSEHILLFRGKEKGEQKTKKEQEVFRQEIREAVGEEIAKQILVIRPTRFGGYTVIFQSEKTRDAALKSFRQNEMLANVDIKSSCIVAPKRKSAKVVCREPPTDYTPDLFMKDFYSLKNSQLHQIPAGQREAKIITTSAIGWIFELSSSEAAACYIQGGKIRYGYGREIKVDEYIPLQQCYKCCAFGHNADDCLSNMSFCRLCGASGHAGKDCLKKDKKEQWKCVNCRITNEAKGYNLPLDHGAAQLHKCPCALNQKMIRKEQLAAAGVFTTPATKESLINKIEQQYSTRGEQFKDGGQVSGNIMQAKSNKTSRPRSKSEKRNRALGKKNEMTSLNVSSSSSSTDKPTSSTSHIDLVMQQSQNGDQERTFHSSRPRSIEGWKFMRTSYDYFENETRGRGYDEKVGGTNSTSNLPVIRSGNDDAQMQ